MRRCAIVIRRAARWVETDKIYYYAYILSAFANLFFVV